MANRGFTEGFYRRHAPADTQNYEDGVSRTDRELFVGEVIEPEEPIRPGWVEIQVKNRFAVGDDLQLLTPAGNWRFRLESMETLEAEPLAVAPGAGWRVRIPLPGGDGRMGLLTRVQWVGLQSDHSLDLAASSISDSPQTRSRGARWQPRA